MPGNHFIRFLNPNFTTTSSKKTNNNNSKIQLETDLNLQKHFRIHQYNTKTWTIQSCNIMKLFYFIKNCLRNKKFSSPFK